MNDHGDYYRNLLAQHGPTYRASDCGSLETQQKRFQVLSTIITEPTASVLDVGCGVGDFVDWMPPWESGDLTQHLDCRYHGIDAVPAIIAAAQAKHPDAIFSVGHLMANTLQADYVIASGLFQFASFPAVGTSLDHLFRLCKKGVAVNFLRHAASGEGTFEPGEMLAHALLFITDYAALRADYLPNDFTLFLYKNG